MSNLYDDDIASWAEQQARLLRTGQWSRLDIDSIAEEIEDVGKSEHRELQSRLCVLISHLLKWSHQPGRRGRSWHNTIQQQRSIIDKKLKRHPSLKVLLNDAEWMAEAYRHARTEAFVDYDPLQWKKELAFWPDELGGAPLSRQQLLVQRCAELLAHLARWQRQEGNQCGLWQRLIVLQRRRIASMLAATPELHAAMADVACLREAWLDALLKTIGEANCFDLPDACPWTLEQALDQDFFPAAYLPS